MHRSVAAAIALAFAGVAFGGGGHCCGKASAWLDRAPPPPLFALSPWSRAVVGAPGQWRGFWYYAGRGELEAMKATGANFVGYSPLWFPVQRREPPHSLGHVAPETVIGAVEMRESFDAPVGFTAVGVSVGGRGQVEMVVCCGDGRVLARRRLEVLPETHRLFVELPRRQPPGKYAWRVRWLAGRPAIWVRPSEACETARLLADGRPWPAVVADTWLRTRGGMVGLLRDVGVPSAIPLGGGYLTDLAQADMHGSLGVGTQNNAYFTWFPEWFWKRWPDAAMRDQAGREIIARGRGFEARWAALEHPAIVAAASAHVRDFVGAARRSPRVAYWVLGGESLYPTYCVKRALADYSEPALHHWRAWCRLRYGRVFAAPRHWRRDVASLRFLRFREQALAELFQYHAAGVRAVDTTRPALVPVHGNIYGGWSRRNMGMRPALWAAMGDGFETGQVVFGADRWKLNLRYFETLGSFRLPVAAARLLQVRRDPAARGGQRGFAPEGLRRMVYEAVGMGAWHVGLVQWCGESWDGEWTIKGTPAEAEARRVFTELARMAPELSSCYPLQPDVAMYLSDSTWLLDGWQGAWTDLHLAFARWHLPVHYIGDDQLLSAPALPYRCIVSMDNAIVPTRVLKALEAFVRRGGCVIVAGRFAEYDEGLRARAPYMGRAGEGGAWKPGEADADRQIWRLGEGRLVHIVNPDYRRLPALLRQAIADSGVRVPVSLEASDESGAEAFVLTDSVNPVAVIINLSRAPLHTRVSLAKWLLPAEKYEWWDLGRLRPLGPYRALDLALQGQQVAVVQARAVIEDARAVEYVMRERSAAARLAARGFDSPLARALRGRAMEHLAAGRLHKAVACARQLRGLLGLSARATVCGETAQLEVRVAAGDTGEPADAQVRVRFSPAGWKWWPMTRTGPGRYSLRISRGDIPRRYDPRTGEYRVWWGPLRAFVQARGGNREGETVVDFAFGQAR